MLDPIASPGDPVFYLHHTYLDYIFWQWQAQNLPARLSDIGGRNIQVYVSTNGSDEQPTFVVPGQGSVEGDDSSSPIIVPNSSAFPPADAMRPLPDSPVQRPEGDPGNVTTLAHILNMFGLIPNATIADVMDIGGPLLCYDYM